MTGVPIIRLVLGALALPVTPIKRNFHMTAKDKKLSRKTVAHHTARLAEAKEKTLLEVSCIIGANLRRRYKRQTGI